MRFLKSVGIWVLGAVLATPLLFLLLSGIAMLAGAVGDRDRSLAVTGALTFVGSTWGLLLIWFMWFRKASPAPLAPERRRRRRYVEPTRTRRERITDWLLLPLIAAVILLAFVIVVILSPLIAVLIAREWVFRWRLSGRYFLVATRRRGWFDFLSNNVIPVLPGNVTVIWDRDQRDPRLRSKLVRRFNCPSGQRPYLVEVRPRRLTVHPLHAPLLPLKAERRRSASVRRSVEGILRDVVVGEP